MYIVNSRICGVNKKKQNKKQKKNNKKTHTHTHTTKNLDECLLSCQRWDEFIQSPFLGKQG